MIILDENSTINVLNNKLDGIVNTSNIENIYEQKTLQYIVFVAKSSREHWEDNLIKWADSTNENNNLSIVERKPWVVKHDAVGAIRGAVLGAWGGAAFGPGGSFALGLMCAGYNACLSSMVAAAIWK